VAVGFQNWYFVLPENGTLEPKHVRDGYLIFELITNVHLVDVIKSVL